MRCCLSCCATTYESPLSSSAVDQVAFLEEAPEVRDLPDTERNQTKEGDPGKVFDSLVCGFCVRARWFGRKRSGAIRGERNESGPTIGAPHLFLALLEVVHLVYDLTRDGLELPHLRFKARKRLLIGDGVVVDGIGTNVDVQVDGEDMALGAAFNVDGNTCCQLFSDSRVVGWTRKSGLTFSHECVLEAHAQVCVAVCVDGHSGLLPNVALGEVDVVVLAAIDDVDIEPLVVGVSRDELRVDGDNDERVGEGVVPDALGRGVRVCFEVELDALHWQGHASAEGEVEKRSERKEAGPLGTGTMPSLLPCRS